MTSLGKRKALILAITAAATLSCACSSPARDPLPAAPPYRTPLPDVDHAVYIATDREVALYRPDDKGLRKERAVNLAQDATVGLAASQQGVFLWRDGDWYGYSPELQPLAHRNLGFQYTYAEYAVASSAGAMVADLGQKVGVVGPDLKIGALASIPGIVDSMAIEDRIAYILDPTMNQHYLVRVDLSRSDAPKVLDQTLFYEGTESKGTHWIDPQAGRWFVLMEDELLTFDMANLQRGPLSRIPCRQQFDMSRLEAPGPFRIWKATEQTPLWALGHDGELAIARLRPDDDGLQTEQRLSLKPSDYPLMSPPFIKRAGSRLYASDGGALWIIDISSDPPRLLATVPFRYGLHLATVGGRR